MTAASKSQASVRSATNYQAWILEERDASEVDAALARPLPRRHGGEYDLAARPHREGRALALQKSHKARADNAKSGDTDA